jgi:sugar phosphate isomerase/epimerase
MRLVLSLCTATLGEHLDLAQTLDLAQQHGFDGVELLGEPCHLPAPQQVRRNLSDRGLRVTALTAASRLETGRDLASRDVGVRRSTLDHLRRCVDFAVEVDCPVVGVAPGAVGRFWTDDHDAEWQFCAEGLVELAAHARPAGVVLGLEVLNRYVSPLVRTVEDAGALLDTAELDDAGIVLDTFHAAMEEESIPRAVEDAAGRIVNVQIADNNRRGVGHGNLDFWSVIDALRASGYTGALALEAFAPGGNPFGSPAPRQLPYLLNYVAEYVPFMRHLELAADGLG